jgi:hypothetical protein
VIARGDRVSIRIKLSRQVAGPMSRGTVVGSAVVFASGRQLGSVPLVLARAIPAVSPLTRVARFVTRASTLVLLAVLLSSAAVLVLRRQQQRRAQQTTA